MSQIAHSHAFQSTIPALAELDRFIYGVYRLRSSQAAAPNTAELRNISAEHEPLENDIRQRWSMVLNAARYELELINRKNPGRILPTVFEPLLDRFSDQFRYMFNHSFGPRDESKTMFFEGVRCDIEELIKLEQKASSLVLAESEMTKTECLSPVNTLVELREQKKPTVEEVADNTQEMPQVSKPDGPVDGLRYRYKGREVDLTGVTYSIVNHMENCESKKFDDLKRLVTKEEEVQDSTLHSWANRANKALRPLNVPWTYSVDSRNRYFKKKDNRNHMISHYIE